MTIKILAISATLAALTLTGCPAPKKTGKTGATKTAPAKTDSAPATPAPSKS